MSSASHVKFHLIDSYCSEGAIPQYYMCKVNVEISYICTSKDIRPVEIRTISYYYKLSNLSSDTNVCLFQFDADYYQLIEAERHRYASANE